jgi:hypothetical protein
LRWKKRQGGAGLGLVMGIEGKAEMRVGVEDW